ncbi:MAG: TolC family protein [Owenweeksia sp.]|nr:TolC family protein [Owenweeksia sp.]
MHPLLRQYGFIVEQKQLDKRLKTEQLKPEVDLHYNALTAVTGQNPLNQYTPSNYKWGLSFSMPLLLRKERGDLRLANLQIEEAELEINNKSADLRYQAINALNSLQTTAAQARISEKTVRDYLALLQGERRLFSSGESSLFFSKLEGDGLYKCPVKADRNPP